MHFLNFLLLFFFYVSFAYQKLNWIYLFVWKWKVWFKVLDSQLDILLARHYFAGLTSAFLLTLTLLWVESTKKMNLEGITGLIWRWQTVFGMIWMDFYLPTLQGRNKWRETVGNLKIRQLVLFGDMEGLRRPSHKCS